MKKKFLFLLFLTAQFVYSLSALAFTPAPTAPSPQNFCEEFYVGQLTATGTDIKWYTEITGGTAIDQAAEQAFPSGTYYVSQTLTGEESTRTEVVVNVNFTAEPTVTSPQTFCEGATIADIVIIGTDIKWKDNFESFDTLPSTTLLTNQSYYVTQTINGCPSQIMGIEIIITTPPVAPNATSPQAFFNSATIADLTTADGTDIKWYSALTGGSPLSSATALVDGTTYYASQKVGCESPRTAVLANITIFKTFYFKSSQSDLTVLANWGINADGSGTIPTTFLGDGFKFILTNTQTLSTTLTLGANTVFQLGEIGLPAVQLNITASGSIASGTVNITGATSGNNTLTIAGATSPNIGTLAMGATGSTVVYNGTGVQQISNSQDYNNLTIDNVNGISASTSLIVNGTFWLKTGKFRVGVYRLSLNGGVTTDSNNAIVGSNSSYLVFGVYNGVSTDCTFFMDNTTPATTNLLENIIVNRTGRVVTLGASVVVNVCRITNGILAIGSNTLTLNGSFTGTATNCLRANGFSDIIVNGSGNMGNLFFDQSIAGVAVGTGAANDLTELIPGTTNNVRNFTLNRQGTSSGGGPGGGGEPGPGGGFGFPGGGAPVITPGTVTLGNQMQINNIVNPLSGVLVTNGNLIMLSTLNSTSSILALPNSGASISGNVVVQSFFKGGTVVSNRGFRMISSPISTNSNFFAKLKERFIVTGLLAETNGFDVNPNRAPNAATITTYNEPGSISNGSFTTLPNINTAAVVGRGYYFFFRGSRFDLNSPGVGKINAPFTAPESWTATYIGTINSGNINYPITKTIIDAFDGFNLVGNPYPATLDFQTFIADAANNSLLDDYISIIKSDRTGFLTQSGGINNGITELDLGNGGNNANLGILRYIQPGQGFFVKATQSGTITFKESHKATLTTSPSAMRLLEAKEAGVLSKKTTNQTRKLIRLNLQDNNNRDDATIVLEDGNDANYGGYDAPYLSNANVVLYSLTNDNVPTSINFMPAVANVQSIKLFVGSNASNANLKITFTNLSGANDKDVWLQDNYLNTKTVVNLNQTHIFGIDKAIASSFGKDRFELLFTDKAVLPLTLVDFNAKINSQGVLLTWKTQSEENIKNIEIERGTTANNFTFIGAKTPTGGLNSNASYSFIDANSPKGILYYRLKITETDGKFCYSNLKTVNTSLDKLASILVYPNPAKTEINVSWNAKETVDLIIYDLAGKKVQTYNNQKTEGCKANLGGLAAGGYIIKLINQATNNIIGVSKFIKE